MHAVDHCTPTPWISPGKSRERGSRGSSSLSTEAPRFQPPDVLRSAVISLLSLFELTQFIGNLYFPKNTSTQGRYQASSRDLCLGWGCILASHTKAPPFLAPRKPLAKKSERNGRNGNPRKSDSDTGKAKNKTRYPALRTQDTGRRGHLHHPVAATRSTFHRATGDAVAHRRDVPRRGQPPSRATIEEGHRVNGLGWADF